MRIMPCVSSVLVLVICAGCTVTAYTPPSVSEEPGIALMLRDRTYRGGGFVRMNTVPYESELAPGSVVTCFVSNDAAFAYQGVTPDLKTSNGGTFPVGGVVVREVADGHGKVTKLTVMERRAAGYFPEVGDFFFGVSDVDGNPMVDADGHAQWGRLDSCSGCHQERAAAGYLFGVRVADRERAQ
jgi:hypothetical protein